MNNIRDFLYDSENQNLMANYHTHTKRCMHAGGTDREYVEAAIEAGFKILGFSDHTPQAYIDFVSRMRMTMSQLEDYVDSILSLKKEYQSDIRILLGLETEYFPALFNALLHETDNYPFDYMIMGQHWLYGERPETVSTKPRTDDEFLKNYVEQVIEGMETGCFSYLAHPDVVNFLGDVTIYKKHMTHLAREMKRMRIPLEINALGFADNRFYPNKAFLEVVSEVGNDCVIGVDAHAPGMFLDESRRQGCLELAKKYNINVLNRIV
ncbi:MAG: histidinol-phosphatase [Clostridia bacterium]|nr:histidinol-phosphatase [Clostridia bacterium]MBQ9973773.1 histidinol-phosphatase [Oscillospiraceae bacterium]